MDTKTDLARRGRAGRGERVTDASEPPLASLIPIAVVIAAGCEPCATSMVERALRQGAPVALVMSTLRIVAAVRSADCFARAVGPEVVARMEKPLRAGRAALRHRGHAGTPGACSCQAPGSRSTGSRSSSRRTLELLRVAGHPAPTTAR